MMWKWTDGDHIKAIILDGDSLDNTYLDYPYQRVVENVNIFKVFKQQSIDNQKNIIIYSDVFELIQNVMNKANCESYSIIAISSNIIFLKEMMQNHIGTILAGSIHEEHLKNIPDFSFVSDEKLNRILNGGHIGNGAEFYALDINVNKKKALIYCRSSVMLNNGFTKNLDLYFGGRYYSKSHHFLKDDALSMVLNELKRKYLKQVDGYFDNAIDVVNRREKIDILTYVPLKPKKIEEGKFDCFQSLELKKAKKKEYIYKKL